MKGVKVRIALVLGAALLAGCGGERPGSVPAPPPIEIVEAAPAPTAEPEAQEARSGSFKTAPMVSAPSVPVAAAPAVAPVKKPAGKPRWSYRRFRDGQLKALRAYCATRPKEEPRCDGTRVNERVAFAGMDR
jgi:hypothetical protein